jgi:hypothetical protein
MSIIIQSRPGALLPSAFAAALSLPTDNRRREMPMKTGSNPEFQSGRTAADSRLATSASGLSHGCYEPFLMKLAAGGGKS